MNRLPTRLLIWIILDNSHLMNQLLGLFRSKGSFNLVYDIKRLDSLQLLVTQFWIPMLLLFYPCYRCPQHAGGGFKWPTLAKKHGLLSPLLWWPCKWKFVKHLWIPVSNARTLGSSFLELAWKESKQLHNTWLAIPLCIYELSRSQKVRNPDELNESLITF